MPTQVLNVFQASIGKKVVMAITGLGFALFVFTHVAANMLIIFSPRAFNEYSHKLTSNPLIYIAEAGLLLIILGHAYTGIRLSWRNSRARPVGYARSASRAKKARFGSSSMVWTGSMLLVFVVLHIITFKYGPYYAVTYDGVEMRDLYRLVLEVFQKPGYVIWYAFCMVLVGVHLSHGFASGFQSLGLWHPRYAPVVRTVGWIYSVGVAGGFFILPLYVYFLKG